MITISEAVYQLRGEDAHVTKRHSHNSIEFIECVSGNGAALKDDHAYPLQSKHLYLIDARRPHNIYPTNLSEYVRNKIVMEADSFFDFCDAMGIREDAEQLLASPPIPTALLPEINHIFETVAALYDAKDVGFAHGYILQLLHLCKKNCNAALAAAPNAFVERALVLVAENAGVTSLEAISTALHLNKYYLCHLFKNKTGINLSDYIAEKRLETGARLLRETALSIEDIATACGFATAPSFTRFFKEKSGIVPREYRKKARM